MRQPLSSQKGDMWPYLGFGQSYSYLHLDMIIKGSCFYLHPSGLIWCWYSGKLFLFHRGTRQLSCACQASSQLSGPALLVLVLNSHSTFHNRYCYHFSFINEKTEAQRGEGLLLEQATMKARIQSQVSWLQSQPLLHSTHRFQQCWAFWILVARSYLQKSQRWFQWEGGQKSCRGSCYQ